MTPPWGSAWTVRAGLSPLDHPHPSNRKSMARGWGGITCCRARWGWHMFQVISCVHFHPRAFCTCHRFFPCPGIARPHCKAMPVACPLLWSSASLLHLFAGTWLLFCPSPASPPWLRALLCHWGRVLGPLVFLDCICVRVCTPGSFRLKVSVLLQGVTAESPPHAFLCCFLEFPSVRW